MQLLTAENLDFEIFLKIFGENPQKRRNLKIKMAELLGHTSFCRPSKASPYPISLSQLTSIGAMELQEREASVC